MHSVPGLVLCGKRPPSRFTFINVKPRKAAKRSIASQWSTSTTKFGTKFSGSPRMEAAHACSAFPCGGSSIV
jgi:hypothetical protein